MPYIRKRSVSRRPVYKRKSFKKRSVRKSVYRGGYSRFGKMSQPELKNVSSRESLAFSPGNSQFTWTMPPGQLAIPQGTGINNRVGNRINGKYLTCKLVIKGLDNTAIAPSRGIMMRYVLWAAKEELGGSTPDGYIGAQTLTSFLNTREVRVLKHGMVPFQNISQSKFITIRQRYNNKVFNFTDNAATSVLVKQNVYLTLISDSQTITVDNESRFWFADP